MKKLKAIEYTVNGKENIEEFAKGILALTNVMSSRKGTIIKIRTHDGTNVVTVVSLIELDGYIEAHMGEIEEKEEKEIYNIEFDDLHVKPHLYEKDGLAEYLDTDLDPIVAFELEEEF